MLFDSPQSTNGGGQPPTHKLPKSEMAEFVGLKVNLIIAPGGDDANRVAITGIVASVDAKTQKLTLKQGSIACKTANSRQQSW